MSRNKPSAGMQLYADAIALGAMLSAVMTHPEGFTAIAEDVTTVVVENRCPRCGYRLDHPYVRHEWPWLGHGEEVMK